MRNRHPQFRVYETYAGTPRVGLTPSWRCPEVNEVNLKQQTPLHIASAVGGEASRKAGGEMVHFPKGSWTGCVLCLTLGTAGLKGHPRERHPCWFVGLKGHPRGNHLSIFGGFPFWTHRRRFGKPFWWPMWKDRFLSLGFLGCSLITYTDNIQVTSQEP